MRFSFSLFEMSIPNVLNTCPSQLQPNGCHYVRGFERHWRIQGVVPIVELFFYFFIPKFREKANWIQIQHHPGMGFFYEHPKEGKGLE